MPRRKSLRWSKFANPLHVKRAHRTPPYPHGPVLTAARIPVHVWLEGHCQACHCARSHFGAAVNTVTHSKELDSESARRSVEAASVVASMQSAKAAPAAPAQKVIKTPLSSVGTANVPGAKGPQSGRALWHAACRGVAG